jgi:hypothetical protein
LGAGAKVATVGFTSSAGVGGVGFATGAATVSDRDALASEADTAGATFLTAGKRKGRAAFTIASTSPANAEATTRKLNHGSLRGLSSAGSSSSSEICCDSIQPGNAPTAPGAAAIASSATGRDATGVSTVAGESAVGAAGVAKTGVGCGAGAALTPGFIPGHTNGGPS